MVSQCQIFLISIPLLIIVGIEGPGSFFVRVAVIWLNDFSAVAIIFGNLMYAVHSTRFSDPDVGAAITRYTQSQRSVVTSRSEVVRISNESLKTVKNPIEEEKEEEASSTVRFRMNNESDEASPYHRS